MKAQRGESGVGVGAVRQGLGSVDCARANYRRRFVPRSEPEWNEGPTEGCRRWQRRLPATALRNALFQEAKLPARSRPFAVANPVQKPWTAHGARGVPQCNRGTRKKDQIGKQVPLDIQRAAVRDFCQERLFQGPSTDLLHVESSTNQNR